MLELHLTDLRGPEVANLTLRILNVEVNVVGAHAGPLNHNRKLPVGNYRGRLPSRRGCKDKERYKNSNQERRKVNKENSSAVSTAFQAGAPACDGYRQSREN